MKKRNRIETFIYKLSHCICRVYDLIYGIDFEKRRDEWNGHRYPYEPTVGLFYRELRRYIYRLYSDGEVLNIVDIGCGKGKMLYVFSKLPVTSVAGLEYTEALVNIARRNISILSERNKIKAPVDIIYGDAEIYDCYDKYNVFYLYNPFDEILMEHFVNKVINSILKYPRIVRIIYCNYLYESVLLNQGFNIETEFYYRTRVYVKSLKNKI